MLTKFIRSLGLPGRPVVALMAVLSLLSVDGAALAQLSWTSANPVLTQGTFWSVAFGNGRFVAVGDAGSIARSDDGAVWQMSRAKSDAPLRAVIFAEGRFLAASENGSLLASTDGDSWTTSESGAPFGVLELGYGAGTYVLAGQSSDVMTSVDGANWQLHARTPGCQFGDFAWGGRIVYGSGRFVATGGCLQSSSDGVTWVRHATNNNSMYGVEFADSQFVATGNHGSIYVSPDGLAWQVQPNAYAANLYGVAYGSGRFVTIGSVQDRVSGLSTDALAWDFQSINYALGGNDWGETRSIAFGNGRFVAVGDAGSILYSADGIDWADATTDLPDRLRAATFGGGKYVAVGDRGVTLSTSNGIDWTPATQVAATDLFGVTYANELFVAVGGNGRILTSTDSTSWIPASTPISERLYSVAFGDQLFVAVGSAGAILTSDDGSTWTSRLSGTPLSLRAVIHGMGRFVAVGDGGVIVTSTDGATWIVVSSGSLGSALFSVAFGNGQFVAMGESQVLRYSDDGVNWNSPSTGFFPTYSLEFHDGRFHSLSMSFQSVGSGGFEDVEFYAPAVSQLLVRDVAFGPSGAVAVGDSGLKLHSSDGTSWDLDLVGTPNGFSRISGIATDGGIFLAVGSDFSSEPSRTLDIAMTSTDGATWAPLSTGFEGGLVGVAHGAGKFVAIGTDATGPGSPNGYARVLEAGVWETRDTGIADYIFGVAYLDNRFFVLGNSGTISVSLDAVSWTPQLLPIPGQVNAAAYGAGVYVVAGAGIATSLDAANWVVSDSGSGDEHGFESMAYGKGKFLAAAISGFSVSADGQTWTHYCSGSGLRKVHFDGSRFVAFTTDYLTRATHPLVSFDGLEWRRGFLYEEELPHSATYANGVHVAVSEYGGISNSLDDLVFSTSFDGVTCPE